MSVEAAIRDAELRLPGGVAAENALDPRWQAIIEVGAYIETDPEPVWGFVDRWGRNDDADLRAAIAACLLEHLLEHHFALVFPRVQQSAMQSANFSDCVMRTWAFGQADLPTNRVQYDGLKSTIARRPANER